VEVFEILAQEAELAELAELASWRVPIFEGAAEGDLRFWAFSYAINFGDVTLKGLFVSGVYARCRCSERFLRAGAELKGA